MVTLAALLPVATATTTVPVISRNTGSLGDEAARDSVAANLHYLDRTGD